nr:hypothetical protein OG781_00265 [Streptomyces sp. NBC_00830]WTB35873.1 hypothetical protein OG781_46315 [Streptomyces sp. NBC_00830]
MAPPSGLDCLRRPESCSYEEKITFGELLDSLDGAPARADILTWLLRGLSGLTSSMTAFRRALVLRSMGMPGKNGGAPGNLFVQVHSG